MYFLLDIGGTGPDFCQAYFCVVVNKFVLDLETDV